ncbi:MAG: 5'-nucleotidase [Ignavibacteria bacterium]|nr:5'-nucleotidase [Ignavibacteria bacterium]
MAYPIDKKLVVGVSSNALFDLRYEDNIYEEKGLNEYNKYQSENVDVIMKKGLAFPFIRRFLNINKVYENEKPVEVVLLSKNSPESGIRVFRSINEYKLDITRSAFTSGESPYKYIPAYNISLFLSTNYEDVNNAIKENYPAGKILQTKIVDDEKDNELRIAFDFDGVIADDESEKVYKEKKQLELYMDYETSNVDKPHSSGILGDFFKKISYFQKLETKKKEKEKEYKKILKTAIITARNAPAHERAIKTLKSWGVTVDNMFLLGGIEKKRILEVLKPHLYLDDQIEQLNPEINNIPLVHIPFGIANYKC